MSKGKFQKSRINGRLTVIAALCLLLATPLSWAANQRPLSQIPVPEPPNLSDFVADKNAAIRLGKALFWEMQVGSDGATACASCHYRAGADPVNVRSRNQIHPGPDTVFGNNNTVINTFTINPVTLANEPLNLTASGNPRFIPNYDLQSFDFPLFQVTPAISRLAIDPLTGFTGDQVISVRDTNDVVGSQGVRLAQFAGIDPNSAVDLSTPLADSLFTLNGVGNIRQVTGRNTPPAVNAVFTFTNFWDGRANNIFNGVNPLGPLDQQAGIWIDNGAALVKQQIAIPNASLASQATGPPLSDVEMSFRGRTFPELGRKMLNTGLTPLGTQLVHPSDGVLGTLSRATLNGDGSVTGNPGLNADYRAMIQAAFQSYLWNSSNTVNLPATIGGAAVTDDFTQMEANFSLFWGLAIQLYESTLVSDRTPFDRFQSGNQNAISALAQRGFARFDSKCAICHSGTEFTSASAGSLVSCAAPDCNSPVFIDNNNHTLIRKEVNPNNFNISLADAGFFNIGVRPTSENPGRGAGVPDFPFPLSFTALARLDKQGLLPFATPVLPLGTDNFPDIVQGSFKTPGLRNVELTPPYFHNGDSLTLDQVVEFYTRGGDFPGNTDLAVAMQPIGNLRGDAGGRFEVVEFLKTLTDERVRNEQAPFDHPELRIPNGVDPNTGADIIVSLPATGGAPASVPPTTLTLNPVVSPTILKNQLIGGTVDSTATISVIVNNGSQIFATVPCPIDPLTLACSPTVGPTSTWNANLAGLVVGHNSIAITATSDTGGDLALPPADILVTPTAVIGGLPLGGNTKLNSATLTIGGAGVATYQYSLNGTPLSADIPVSTPIVLDALADGEYVIDVVGNGAGDVRQPANQATRGIWRVKANPPVLTLDAVNTPMGRKTLTIGGTVELGSVPSVRVDTAAKPGTVKTIGGTGIATWSCDITDLAAGVNNITVTALDFVFNLSTVNGSVTVIYPDGNIKGTGTADISDALKALRFAVNIDQPSSLEMLHGDVAPLVNGVPEPNSTIDIADALTILRKVVGLINF